MAGRRSTARGLEWTPPSDQELVVLQRQIREAIGEAAEIKAKDYGNDGWSPWSSHIRDLVGRAFGPDSPQSQSMHRVSFGKPDHQSHVAWRNELIDEKIEAAERVVKAIGLELERRGAKAQPAAALPARSFAKVANLPLRGIAERDYDELRKIASSTTMAAALLAGGVIEAVLYDALQQRGFAAAQLDKMRLVDLVNEAVNAKLIRPRAQTAGHAVRETRNLIHPAVELQQGRLTKHDAELVVALMQIVLEDLL